MNMSGKVFLCFLLMFVNQKLHGQSLDLEAVDDLLSEVEGKKHKVEKSKALDTKKSVKVLNDELNQAKKKLKKKKKKKRINLRKRKFKNGSLKVPNKKQRRELLKKVSEEEKTAKELYEKSKLPKAGVGKKLKNVLSQ